MITVKNDAIRAYPNSLQLLALVDALTNIKSGSSVKSILKRAFSNKIVISRLWNKSEYITDISTDIFLIKDSYYVAIPVDLYVYSAMLFAEYFYLKSNTEEEAVVWKMNYILQNSLEAANHVLKLKGRKENFNVKTKVLEIFESSVKNVYSRYEKRMDNYVCLKIKIIE